MITRVAVAALAVMAAAVGLREERKWAEELGRGLPSAWQQCTDMEAARNCVGGGCGVSGGAPSAGAHKGRAFACCFSPRPKARGMQACVHRGDVEAAGALDIHEEGVGRLHQPLELVPPLLQLLGRVQQVHVPHRDEAHRAEVVAEEDCPSCVTGCRIEQNVVGGRYPVGPL